MNGEGSNALPTLVEWNIRCVKLGIPELFCFRFVNRSRVLSPLDPTRDVLPVNNLLAQVRSNNDHLVSVASVDDEVHGRFLVEAEALLQIESRLDAALADVPNILLFLHLESAFERHSLIDGNREDLDRSRSESERARAAKKLDASASHGGDTVVKLAGTLGSLDFVLDMV